MFSWFYASPSPPAALVTPPSSPTLADATAAAAAANKIAQGKQQDGRRASSTHASRSRSSSQSEQGAASASGSGSAGGSGNSSEHSSPAGSTTSRARRLAQHSHTAQTAHSQQQQPAEGAQVAPANHAPPTVAAPAAPAPEPAPRPNVGSTTDEQWWRDALQRMPLDVHSFIQPLVLAGGVMQPAQLGAPFTPAASHGADSPVFPYFHLSEEAYLSLAPRVLAAFPSVALLRFKLVPARISEERFWRTLFLLVAQFHEAHVHAGPGAGTGATQGTMMPPHAEEGAQRQASSAQPPRVPRSNAQPQQSPTANGNSPAAPAQSVTLPSAAAHSPRPSGSPPSVAAAFPALPPMPHTQAGAANANAGGQQQRPQQQQSHQQSPSASADNAAQLRELQAALASRDAQIASQAAHISLLQQQLQGVTSQLQVMHNALQHSFHIMAAGDINSVRDAHASAPAMSPTPTAASPTPNGSRGLPEAPAGDLRLSTAPLHSSASSPALSSASSHPPPAPRLLECGRCHVRMPADAPASSASSAAAPCRTHAPNGSWTLSKDSVEFFELPEELKQNLRAEKQRRLATVRKEMRFIVDTDDKTQAPGHWSCCNKEEYGAPGCKQHTKHALQPAK